MLMILTQLWPLRGFDRTLPILVRMTVDEKIECGPMGGERADGRTGI